MVQQHPMAREDFIGGLYSVVLRDEHGQTVKNRALKLLLFTGALDGDLQRVQFALDKGACANWGLDPASKRILTNMGWTVPDIEPILESADVPETMDQSLSSDEAFLAD